jgi:hypothetical protein
VTNIASNACKDEVVLRWSRHGRDGLFQILSTLTSSGIHGSLFQIRAIVTKVIALYAPYCSPKYIIFYVVEYSPCRKPFKMKIIGLKLVYDQSSK